MDCMLAPKRPDSLGLHPPVLPSLVPLTGELVAAVDRAIRGVRSRQVRATLQGTLVRLQYRGYGHGFRQSCQRPHPLACPGQESLNPLERLAFLFDRTRSRNLLSQVEDSAHIHDHQVDRTIVYIVGCGARSKRPCFVSQLLRLFVEEGCPLTILCRYRHATSEGRGGWCSRRNRWLRRVGLYLGFNNLVCRSAVQNESANPAMEDAVSQFVGTCEDRRPVAVDFDVG